MSQKNKNKRMIAVNTGILLLGFVIMGLGAFYFGMAYHSIDLGQNVRWLNAEYDIELVDIALDGQTLTDTEMYQEGWKWLFRSVLMMIFTTMFFMTAFVNINLMLENANK